MTYRRLGHDGAGWPGTFLDVGAAIDHLRVLAERYPLDLERVVVFGHSAGMMAAFGGHGAMEARADEYGGRLVIRAVPDSDHFQLITPGHPTWQPVRAAILEELGVH